MERKHCEKTRNCLFRATSPFPTVFSKDLYCRHVKIKVINGLIACFMLANLFVEEMNMNNAYNCQTDGVCSSLSSLLCIFISLVHIYLSCAYLSLLCIFMSIQSLISLVRTVNDFRTEKKVAGSISGISLQGLKIITVTGFIPLSLQTCFCSCYMGKQPVAWKEYCVKWW